MLRTKMNGRGVGRLPQVNEVRPSVGPPTFSQTSDLWSGFFTLVCRQGIQESVSMIFDLRLPDNDYYQKP